MENNNKKEVLKTSNVNKPKEEKTLQSKVVIAKTDSKISKVPVKTENVKKINTDAKTTKIEVKNVKNEVKEIKADDKKIQTEVKVDSKNTKKTKAPAPVIKKTVHYVKASELNKKLFDAKVNTQAIFDSIMSERASRRQGTHQVKNRSAVAGGGIKPWKQKGTGRARAGTLSSPIFRSGGVIFGPQKNRNYKLAVNRKVKVLAFASALTLKAKENGIFIHDFKIDKPSTKTVINFIKTIDLTKTQKKILFISNNVNLYKSTANLEFVNTIKLSNLLIEKILHYDVLIFSKDAYKSLEGRA